MPTTSATSPPYQIHHYPASLIDTRTLRNGARLTLRPVLPQDCLLIGELMVGLSPAARHQRFHGAVKLSAARLLQMSCVDYARQLAVVVTAQVDGTERVIADARYCVGDDQSAEFALVVDEQWQRQGVGAWALNALQQAASAADVGVLQGAVECSNAAMLGLAQHCGLRCTPDPEDDRRARVEIQLGTARRAAPGPRPAPRRRVAAWLSHAALMQHLRCALHALHTPRAASRLAS